MFHKYKQAMQCLFAAIGTIYLPNLVTSNLLTPGITVLDEAIGHG